jgi:hypothetical protein
MLFMVKTLKININNRVATCTISKIVSKSAVYIKYFFGEKVFSCFQIRTNDEKTSTKFVDEFDEKVALELYSLKEEHL